MFNQSIISRPIGKYIYNQVVKSDGYLNQIGKVRATDNSVKTHKDLFIGNVAEKVVENYLFNFERDIYDSCIFNQPHPSVSNCDIDIINKNGKTINVKCYEEIYLYKNENLGFPYYLHNIEQSYRFADYYLIFTYTKDDKKKYLPTEQNEVLNSQFKIKYQGFLTEEDFDDREQSQIVKASICNWNKLGYHVPVDLLNGRLKSNDPFQF